MKYEIKGTPLPVVEIALDSGESIKCQGGAMSWMSGNMQMETSGGGLGKIFTKAITGEALFHNIYTARGGEGYIAFAASLPGQILAVPVTPGNDIICQKSSYLASTPGVEISVSFQKKLGAGFFGGEGFIMQRIRGDGLVFLEIDGMAETKQLAAGERLIVDTGILALMDATCSIDIETVGSVKNAIFGGEGLFNTVITGPGNVTLQTMPASRLASSIVSPAMKSR